MQKKREKKTNNQRLTWWESSALWLLLLLFVVHQFLHSFASMAVGVVSIGPLLDLTLGPSLSTVTSMDELVLVHVVNVCFVETVLNEITRHCFSLKIKTRIVRFALFWFAFMSSVKDFALYIYSYDPSHVTHLDIVYIHKQRWCHLVKSPKSPPDGTQGKVRIKRGHRRRRRRPINYSKQRVFVLYVTEGK